MPGITPKYQQHRQTTGNHHKWLAEQQQNQPSFAARVQDIARTPGMHSGNRGQCDNALALLQLFTLLSSVYNNDHQPLLTSAKADARSFPNATTAVDNPAAPGIGSGIATLFNCVTDALQQAGHYISEYDPLKFPAAEGRAQPGKQFVGKQGDDRIVIEDMYGTIEELSRNYYDVQNKTEPYRFVKEGEKALRDYYKNYNAKYPKLNRLAKNILKKEIKKAFKLDLDPDKYNFMQFKEIEYDGRNKIQFGPPHRKRTLTDCLFTNFEADIQDNMQDMDAMCGIYPKSMANNKKFDANKAVAIKPTDFINLVWRINFYQKGVNAIRKFFNNENMQVKKAFLDLVDNLNLSKLDNAAAKDVFSGVNILENHDIAVSLFDIDGYPAANAYVFENVSSGRVTLYFPWSDFKFKSFADGNAMRTWVTDSCGKKDFRDMLETHFSLANRRDGVIYSGVDSWINTIDKDHRYYDKIARKPTPVSPENFFSEYVQKLKDKALSDADTLIRSDSEVTRDLWENALDASNQILPTPLNLFGSLTIHLEHAIEADSFTEKMDEWEKLKSDILNIATLVVFSDVIKLPNVEGYEFIESVKKGVDTESIRRAVKFSQMEEVYAPEAVPEGEKDPIIEGLLDADSPFPPHDDFSVGDLFPSSDEISLGGSEDVPGVVQPAVMQPAKTGPAVAQPAKSVPDAAPPPGNPLPDGAQAAKSDPLNNPDPFKNLVNPQHIFSIDDLLEVDEIHHFVKTQDQAQAGPVVNQPAPIVNQPVPVVNQPAPVINQPAPVVNPPVPVVNQPAPVVNQPVPVMNQPAPVAIPAAPVVQQTIPVAWKVVPTLQEGGAIAWQVFPVVKQTAPVAEQTVAGQAAPVVIQGAADTNLVAVVEQPAQSASASVAKPQQIIPPYAAYAKELQMRIGMDVRSITRFLPFKESPILTNMEDFDRSLVEFVSEKLLNHPWDLYIGFQDSIDRPVPPYIRLARSRVKMYVKKAEDMVLNGLSYLKDPTNNQDINTYLQGVIGCRDKAVIAEARSRLELQTQRIANYLLHMEAADYTNIIIISTKQQMEKYASKGLVTRYHSTIPDIEYLKVLPKGFVAKGDPHRRIFIMYDAIPEFELNGFDSFGRRRNNMESTIIHEVSHLITDTKDYFPNEIDPVTFEYGSAASLLKKFRTALTKGEIGFTYELKMFMDDVYRFYRLGSPATEEVALDLLKKSRMLQANMLIENADNYVAYIKEIGDLFSPQEKVAKPKQPNKKPRNDQSQTPAAIAGTSGTNLLHRAARDLREKTNTTVEPAQPVKFTDSRDYYQKPRFRAINWQYTDTDK